MKVAALEMNENWLPTSHIFQLFHGAEALEGNREWGERSSKTWWLFPLFASFPLKIQGRGGIRVRSRMVKSKLQHNWRPYFCTDALERSKCKQLRKELSRILNCKILFLGDSKIPFCPKHGLRSRTSLFLKNRYRTAYGNCLFFAVAGSELIIR